MLFRSLFHVRARVRAVWAIEWKIGTSQKMENVCHASALERAYPLLCSSNIRDRMTATAFVFVHWLLAHYFSSNLIASMSGMWSLIHGVWSSINGLWSSLRRPRCRCIRFHFNPPFSCSNSHYVFERKYFREMVDAVLEWEIGLLNIFHGYGGGQR